MSSETRPLVVEQVNEIVLIKLNRPEKRNALNDATIDALKEFFTFPPAGTKVVVLHGEGQHFCAGLDLSELIGKGKRSTLDGVRHSRNWHRVFDLIQFGEVPVISVLKGGVIGGGLELAAATHVRVCEPSTFFQLPEGQRGIFPGGGATVRVPRIIGAGRVIEMMLTGRSYNANDGLRLGLAHHLAAEGEGLEAALSLAAIVAGNPETSNYTIINGIAKISEMGPAEGLFAETMTATVTAGASEGRERIRAFLDSRSSSQNNFVSNAAAADHAVSPTAAPAFPFRTENFRHDKE